MTGLVLLVGVLWVFGGLQSGVLAQDGGKFSYPRALERLESLVATLNESLHETKEDLHEVRLCLNLTKKILGKVQEEKESLEAALLETRSELSATKSLHQQGIDELRAAQDSSRVEALERQGSKLEKGLKQVRRKVNEINNEQLPRQLNELTGDFAELKRDLRRLEDENLPRKVSEVFVKLVTAEFRYNSSITKLKEDQRQLQVELETKLEAALTMQDEQVANMVQELMEKHNSLELKLDKVAIGEEEWESRIASSRVVEEVRMSVRVLEGALSNMTAVAGKGLKKTKGNFSALKDEVEKVQNELCEKVQNLTIILEDAKESSEESITVMKREINRSSSLAATQQKSIDRLTTQVTQQGQSVNQLSDNVTDQGRRLDNLTSTVEEQGSSIASLKEDVEWIKSDFSDVTTDLRRLEDENLPRRVSEVFVKLVTAEFRYNSTATKLKGEQRQIRSEVQMLDTKLKAALTMQDEQVANMVQELMEKHNSLELKLNEVVIGEEEWESRIASSGVVEEVRVSVRVLEGALSNMTAVTGKELKEIKANFGALKDEVEKVQNELCEKVQNVTIMFEDAKESSEESITVIKREKNGSRSLAATQQESIDRLTTQVTRQGQRVNQLNDSVTDQGKRLDNLTSIVEEQDTCIASLKEDVEWIKSGGITDCYDAMMKGYNESGVYTIRPNNAKNSFSVYCDMETDGGGWTVLLKRQDGSVDFYRNWADYKSSFGNLTGEHWLGLDNMYLLTHQSSAPPQLRVDLADWEGNTSFAKYDQFSVGAEDSDYTLSVSGYQSASTAGDSLTAYNGYHNGQRFSTPDRDNDAWVYHCAVHLHGPWWHNRCYNSLLTGKYYTSGGPKSSAPYGINWGSWKGLYSLRVAEMKIRPGGV